jgi:hypothetical protein
MSRRGRVAIIGAFIGGILGGVISWAFRVDFDDLALWIGVGMALGATFAPYVTEDG